jgi:hypothetical protein
MADPTFFFQNERSFAWWFPNSEEIFSLVSILKLEFNLTGLLPGYLSLACETTKLNLIPNLNQPKLLLLFVSKVPLQEA